MLCTIHSEVVYFLHLTEKIGLSASSSREKKFDIGAIKKGLISLGFYIHGEENALNHLFPLSGMLLVLHEEEIITE